MYDLQHLLHLNFKEFVEESMELVELWLCDLVILLNTGTSGGNGNICSSLTLGSDDGGYPASAFHLVPHISA